MSKEYEAYQTWLAHCIEQGMVVRIVTQQRTPNGYITFTGDVKGMLKANEFHLTFREVEAINTPTQDELRKKLFCSNCKGLGRWNHNPFEPNGQPCEDCSYGWNPNLYPPDVIALIEAYKDNACKKAFDDGYKMGIEFGKSLGKTAERNNLNKSKEEK